MTVYAFAGFQTMVEQNVRCILLNLCRLGLFSVLNKLDFDLELLLWLMVQGLLHLNMSFTTTVHFTRKHVSKVCRLFLIKTQPRTAHI